MNNKELIISKEIEKMINETDNIMNECSIQKILAKAEVLKKEDFKDFLIKGRRIYLKHSAYYPDKWEVLGACFDAALDLLRLRENVSYELMQILLTNIDEAMNKVAEEITDKIIEKSENGEVVIDNLN